jgi:hypothetical protein
MQKKPRTIASSEFRTEKLKNTLRCRSKVGLDAEKPANAKNCDRNTEHKAARDYFKLELSTVKQRTGENFFSDHIRSF